MSFSQTRIENLEVQIALLNGELSRLRGEVRPYDARVVRAAEVHFQLEDLPQKSRRRRYVKARCVVTQILREEGYSLPEIGDILKRDHSTIIHYLKLEKPETCDVTAVRRLID